MHVHAILLESQLRPITAWKNNRDNYTKLSYDLGQFHVIYMWFKKCYFIQLRLAPLLRTSLFSDKNKSKHVFSLSFIYFFFLSHTLLSSLLFAFNPSTIFFFRSYSWAPPPPHQINKPELYYKRSITNPDLLRGTLESKFVLKPKLKGC